MSFATNTPQPLEDNPPAVVNAQPLPETLASTWENHGSVTTIAGDGAIVISKAMNEGAGTEQGLAGKLLCKNAALSFEVWLESGACFVAKIHQSSATDQHSNSYHLMSQGARSYIARHNNIFGHFALPVATWVPVKMAYLDGIIALHVNGEVACRARDSELEEGYCFLGVKGGTVRLRNLKVEEATPEDVRHTACPPHQIFYDSRSESAPLVSIITTVYDRVECLERCLRTVRALHFQDYEQIVVADCPPTEVLEELLAISKEHGQEHGKLLFANLDRRFNDWGIGPASAGLNLARGKYVCFLSDDNGYTPDHAGPLIEALNKDHNLGFVYSSCLYDGRMTLQYSPPRFGRIDLGQPLFRRELFDVYMNGTLPFTEAAWDWRMIQTLVRKGVRWRHINRPTFIFRLDKYPHLIPAKV
jgi:hypothetical protein